MAASDPFLERAIARIRDFAMDTIDEVRYPAASIVELIDTANALVFGEMLACAEPKTRFRFAESTIAISSAAEDYDWPGNVRKFVRLVKKDSLGRITNEYQLTDYLSDLPGIIILDEQRGFRVTPPPANAQAEDWTLAYEAGVTPYLCYGNVQSATATTAVLTAPSGSQLGTLSIDEQFYTNSYVRIVSGTGAGQERRILNYAGSTRTITVKTWSVNPTGSSIYEIMPCLKHPLDKAIMWRAAMMMKAGDADLRHRQSAQLEFNDTMREILTRVSGRQGRQGPSLGDDYMELFDYGEV